MNISIKTGRIASDVKVSYVTKGSDVSAVLNFNLAVPDRSGRKDEDGNFPCDFFRVVCFGALAELIEKYCVKGDKILVFGKDKNNNYEKDGSMVYSQEIIASEVEFLETKGKGTNKETSKKK